MILALTLLPAYRGGAPRGQEDRYADLETLAEILVLVRDRAATEVSNRQLVEGAIDGLLDQLDPHSVFYNADRYRMMKEDQRGSFCGIGINIGIQNKRLTVIAPIEGTPAARAGLRAGDVIMAIDGEKTVDMTLDQAITRLRGEIGQPVRVSLKRSGVIEPWEVTLVRAEIPSNNVRAAFLIDDQTGYVALRDFGESATGELVNAIRGLHSDGMNQLILDLRGNPGGLLPQAIGVAGLFLPGEKVIVSTKGRLDSANQDFLSEPESPLAQVPLIVLIDRGSASASEIVAGAIQDHDRGLIIGVTSWGKGLVQSVFPIGNGGQGLALTTARYYTPSGRHIQGRYDSFDDYYHPSEDPAQRMAEGLESPDERDVFQTDQGRYVIQMRGIMPDVYLAYPDIPPSIQNLEVRHNAFFNFATQAQDRFSDFDLDAPPGDALLDAFGAYLKAEDLMDLWHDAAQFPHVVIEKLAYQFLSTRDQKKAWHFLMKHDFHVKAALELFPKAKELLVAYRGDQGLPEHYSAELKRYARQHAKRNAPLP